jgi:hypothetical protein
VLAITDHVWDETDPVLFNPVMKRIGGPLNRMVSQAIFHLYLNEIKSLAQYAKKRFDMTLITGVEISKRGWHKRSNEADIVILDIKDYVSADKSPLEVLQEIKSQNAVSLAAHPFKNHWLWQNHKKIRNLVDVWEYKNGGNGGVKYFPHVKEAGLRHVACDDFHKLKHLGRAVTYLSCQNELEQIKSMLKQGVNFDSKEDVAVIYEAKNYSFLSLLDRQLV